MLRNIEDFLLNRFAGKLIARGAVTAAAFIAGPLVQALAANTGVHIALDQAEVQAAFVLGAHAAFEWFKARRMANPNSPTVQTDKSKEPAPAAQIAS